MDFATHPTPTAAPAAIDVTVANFMQEVVQPSAKMPIVLYFWAPWCSTCKGYGPLLEKQVAAHGGVKLAKVNIDANTQIAAQFRIQSVPATYVFLNGQPVDGFAGALPESEIAKLLQQIAPTGVPAAPPLEEWLAEAQTLDETGHAEQALALYAEIHAHLPDQPKLVGHYAKALIRAGDKELARKLLGSLPESAKDESVDAARASLKLMDALPEGANRQALEAKLQLDADDHDARFMLAGLLYANGDIDGAVEALLRITASDREWSERKARSQLLTIFEALGPQHPASMQGRRRLSSLLFS